MVYNVNNRIAICFYGVMNMEMKFSSCIEVIKGFSVIRMDDIKKIAKETTLSIKEVEISLLNEGIIPYRYIGNVRSIGIDGQIKLLNSTVCIIGCGGLGGSIVELCARLGIGKLILVDGDMFDESNLNRQLLSTEDMIGRYKAECGRDRVKSINSGIEVIINNIFIDRNNIGHIIEGSDCVIDALDNIEGRLVLQDACKKYMIPMVHGAIGDMLIHVTAIMPGDDTLNKIYSREFIKSDKKEMGNPAVTPWLCAALEVSEAVKILLKNGELLRNKLLHFDWMYNDFNIFNI